MTYAVKEIYYTLQGEGANSGRAAVFCRFAGCNLWTGHEKDRTSAKCSFCDTDFIGNDGPGGGHFKTADELASAVEAAWPESSHHRRVKPLVVCTGGEPLLQLDGQLVAAFHDQGFEIAIETNGTRLPPSGVDWICVSPKANTEIVLNWGNELKLAFPQEGVDPERYESLAFQHFFLQPIDGSERRSNTHDAIHYCLAHPKWRLSLQTHKLIGIP